MKQKYFPLLFIILLTFQSIFAQQHIDNSRNALNTVQIFGLLEMPFLVIAFVFSFLTAIRLKGGAFGSGMSLLAWGFVVMALGHLHMQIGHIFNYNIFQQMLGKTIGDYFWYIALIMTWGLSALGFYKIYRASKI